jgi:hypothetical protein
VDADNESFTAYPLPGRTNLLDGLELLPPGIVPLAEWRAKEEPQPRPPAEHIAVLAAVARIP